MAGSIDYARLRDQTLDSAQEEEAVTVNTRALIDKVLARYSGEWTTLRELIQNAADASATQVIIKFDTLPSSTVPTPQSTDPAERLKHVVLHHTLHRLLVTNNGQVFNGSDWSRLKRIAEGNPDETKIGAFGVGFYSVFADCETPFVASGDETMAFYWKGNSLFTRKGRLPAGKSNKDTCFVLDYRNTTSAVPNLLSICQFLSTSLTFVGLERIELWLDDWNIFTLSKKSAPLTQVPIPKDIETKVRGDIMKVISVEDQNSQIDAAWSNIVGWTPVHTTKRLTPANELERNSSPSLRTFFSRITGTTQTSSAAAKQAAREEEESQRAIEEDLAGKSEATVFIRISTVHIKCIIKPNFAAELERATKKPPPKQTKIAILTSSFDEAAASLSTLKGAAARKAAEIITSILPVKNGRIFIGFPTQQTTGLLAHISAPSLIPTVERESIDLNARYVRQWNTELLSAAGIACRIAYSKEMDLLRTKLVSESNGSNTGAQFESAVAKLCPSALHTLKQYTFKESTPLAKAGSMIEEAFWTCTKTATIEVFSSRGVLQCHEVRIASENLSFVNRIPIVPDELMKGAKGFIAKLQDFGLLSDITTSDIKKELERQALEEEQLHEFIKWLAAKSRTNFLETDTIQALLYSTIVNIKPDESGRPSTPLVLRDIQTFLNSARISTDLPTPSHTMPHRFTSSVTRADLQSFGWEELQMVPWLRYIIESGSLKQTPVEQDMTRSEDFSSRVLAVLSKAWDSMSQSSRETTIELLSPRVIIPTKAGMKKPADAYFPSVKLFEDLPIITNLPHVKEKFLKSLGVRKTIELSVIFQRLMASNSEKGGAAAWSHVDLIRYLVTVWSDIPQDDIKQLTAMPLCPAETTGDSPKATSQRFRLSELYEPKDALRKLQLPILYWPGSAHHWNPYSSEGKFLRMLGLKTYPSAHEVVKLLAASSKADDKDLYERGLQYFLENSYQNNYSAAEVRSMGVAFLPASNRDTMLRFKPEDCFADAKCGVLDFTILREDLRSHAGKFGISEDPAMQHCAMRLLQSPPSNPQEARKTFAYFAGRLADITKPIAEALGSNDIVPVGLDKRLSTEKTRRYRMIAPLACFLGTGEEYGDIFDYVDFGSDANTFLLKVGSKHEPSIQELVQHIIRDPGAALSQVGAVRYRNMLQKLHVNMTVLKKDKLLWREMKSARFLLAYKERPTQFPINEDDDDEQPAAQQELRLCRAEEIVISDDLITYNLFKQHLLVAPQDEALEDLYWSLGTPVLSSAIDKEIRLGPRQGDQQTAEQLRLLLLERARLFLHEQSSEAVLHDTKWLEKNLEVQLVQSISLRRTLRNHNVAHTEKRTAELSNQSNSKATLSITAKYDVFEISHAVLSVIIRKPKTQMTMLFEMFLTTSLSKLRTRGYNVDRILRRKAAEEARIAEAENQRRIEEERKKLEARAGVRQVDVSGTVAIPETPKSKVPGAFHDSPEQASIAQPDEGPQDRGLREQKHKGFFSSITKNLGFDNLANHLEALEQGTSRPNPSQREPSRQISSQPDLTNHDVASQALQTIPNRPISRPPAIRDIAGQEQTIDSAPPPYSPFSRDPRNPPGFPTGTSGGSGGGAVSSPASLDRNLQSAITASRAFGGSTVFSRPTTSNINEVASYCDARPGHDLVLIGRTTNPTTQLPIYVDRSLALGAAFLEHNAEALASFAAVLSAAGSVFPLDRRVLHVYHDEVGQTIAFNQSGSIFCNYRFFRQLHLRGIEGRQGKTDAIVYWWVTICHELAHNLVEDHSSQHSFWTETFVAKYFPTLAGILARVGAD